MRRLIGRFIGRVFGGNTGRSTGPFIGRPIGRHGRCQASNRHLRFETKAMEPQLIRIRNTPTVGTAYTLNIQAQILTTAPLRRLTEHLFADIARELI